MPQVGGNKSCLQLSQKFFLSSYTFSVFSSYGVRLVPFPRLLCAAAFSAYRTQTHLPQFSEALQKACRQSRQRRRRCKAAESAQARVRPVSAAAAICTQAPARASLPPPEASAQSGAQSPYPEYRDTASPPESEALPPPLWRKPPQIMPDRQSPSASAKANTKPH